MSITNEIEFKLSGRECTLKPSIKAARVISRMAGGFNNVYSRLAAEDMDAIYSVINAGISPKMSTEDLEQAIYETGTRKLTEPCAKFVRLLQNGGRDEEDADEEQGPLGND